MEKLCPVLAFFVMDSEDAVLQKAIEVLTHEGSGHTFAMHAEDEAVVRKFGGVHVSKGSVVRNSILMQDTYVGKDVELNCVITDKNVMIGDGCDLSGHETRPFYIEKGAKI
ncbi:MAG: hypothetical protein IIX09_07030 [Clostridia bacterium]|nr:hypothetical protein [Clostridia bacterium]